MKNKTKVFIEGLEMGKEVDVPLFPYRKKPVLIYAAQILLPFKVETLEGTMQGKPGDWLIQGVEGEFYPCKNEIFRKTYDEVKK